MAFNHVLWQGIFVAVAAALTFYYMGKGPMLQRKMMEFLHGKPGCLPVPDVGNITLHYFSTRGRAEVIRLLLEESQMNYVEQLYTPHNWTVFKKKGTEKGLFTFGQVPAIETTAGMSMVQTQAILHYLGQASGLDCDCEDYIKCEQLALGVEDARSKLSRMLYDPNFSIEDRDHYLKEVMPLWLGYFEKLAPSLMKQKQAFFVGDRLTWVDFLIFDLVDFNIEFSRYDFGLQTVQVDVLGRFPKLANHYRQIAGRPRLALYLQGRRPFTIPNLPQGATKSS